MECDYSHYPDWRCRCLFLGCLPCFFELHFPRSTYCAIPSPVMNFQCNDSTVNLSMILLATGRALGPTLVEIIYVTKRIISPIDLGMLSLNRY